jgi:hypothetical protein
MVLIRFTQQRVGGFPVTHVIHVTIDRADLDLDAGTRVGGNVTRVITRLLVRRVCFRLQLAEFFQVVCVGCAERPTTTPTDGDDGDICVIHIVHLIRGKKYKQRDSFEKKNETMRELADNAWDRKVMHLTHALPRL